MKQTAPMRSHKVRNDHNVSCIVTFVLSLEQFLQRSIRSCGSRSPEMSAACWLVIWDPDIVLVSFPTMICLGSYQWLGSNGVIQESRHQDCIHGKNDGLHSIADFPNSMNESMSSPAITPSSKTPQEHPSVP